MKKILLLFTATIWVNSNMPEAPPMNWKLIAEQNKRRSESLTPRNVYDYLIRSNVLYADIVFRQVLHETGNLTSRLCREKNNLFGMTHTINSTPPKLEFILYPNWKESVMAYKRWQDRHRFKGRDMSDYYHFLENVKYATDSLYTMKLKKINIQKYLL